MRSSVFAASFFKEKMQFVWMPQKLAPLDLTRPFSCLVRKSPKKDELVISFHRKGLIFAQAHITTVEDLKPFRCRIRVNQMDFYMQPKELLAGVEKARQLVLVDDQATRAGRGQLEALFRASPLAWARPCRFCMLQGSVKFPRPPITYGVEEICLRCARSQFIKEARAKGWQPSEALVAHLGRVLERARDYDTAFRMVSPDYDPDRDWHLSLYDVIEKKPSSEERMAIDGIARLYPDADGAAAFVSRLKETGIRSLLPVQAAAVKAGLLEGRNILIVSSTSSGKTLIAEMAGIPRALTGAKFLYLTPLVALANLRYFEFDSKYRALGLRTAIRVGVGRIRTAKKLDLNMDIEGSHILVGTYEGVEQTLRSGATKRLGDVGVVTIDEIQNLADQERGSRLDGLIKKLKVLYPRAQFLYLSATVGNPSELATRLKASLVLHDERPVPLERHLIPISTPGQKTQLMRKLIEREFAAISPEGYRGQTLVFTNSRRKCHQIATAIATGSAPVKAYHSGLSYERRRALESEFMEQRIAGVATTSALAAGVDLPASQVIFETLAMGMEWITPSEFHQMLGRAGRLGYHGAGKAIMLIEPGRSFSNAERRTEDQVAMDLLTSRIDPVSPAYRQEELAEQVLADISTFGVLSASELERIQNHSVGFTSGTAPLVEGLARSGMIRRKEGSLVITAIGRTASEFFLAEEEAAFMIRSVKKGSPPLDTVVATSSFDRVYLSEKLQKNIERSFRRQTSIRFFDSEVLNLLSRPKGVFSEWFREAIGRITLDLLACGCRDSPHCQCPPRKLSAMILRLRTSGLSPEAISNEIMERYGIEAYPGDVLEYLNDAARLSEALCRLSEILDRRRLADKSHELYLKIVG